jgi:hypothetical protein
LVLLLVLEPLADWCFLLDTNGNVRLGRLFFPTWEDDLTCFFEFELDVQEEDWLLWLSESESQEEESELQEESDEEDPELLLESESYI